MLLFLLAVAALAGWYGSKRWRISFAFPLVLVGILLHNFLALEAGVYVKAAAILAVIILVFEHTARFRVHEFDSFTTRALQVVVTLIVLHGLFFTPAVYFLFGIQQILPAMWMGILLIGIGLHQQSGGTTFDRLLEKEALVNAPFVIVLSFFLLIFYFFRSTISYPLSFIPAIKYISLGLGMGLFVWILMLRMLKLVNLEWCLSLILIFLPFSYLGTEYLGGSGILAVFMVGLFYGNAHLKSRSRLNVIMGQLSEVSLAFVFLLLGYLLDLSKFNLGLLFLLFLLFFLRWAGLYSTFHGEHLLTSLDKLWMTFLPQLSLPAALAVYLSLQGVILEAMVDKTLLLIGIGSLVSFIIQLVKRQ